MQSNFWLSAKSWRWHSFPQYWAILQKEQVFIFLFYFINFSCSTSSLQPKQSRLFTKLIFFSSPRIINSKSRKNQRISSPTGFWQSPVMASLQLILFEIKKNIQDETWRRGGLARGLSAVLEKITESIHYRNFAQNSFQIEKLGIARSYYILDLAKVSLHAD